MAGTRVLSKHKLAVHLSGSRKLLRLKAGGGGGVFRGRRME
jgi:hypothetical protein